MPWTVAKKLRHPKKTGVMQLNTDISVELLHYSSTHSLFTDVDLSYHNLLLALCSMSSAEMSFSASFSETHRDMEKRRI